MKNVQIICDGKTIERQNFEIYSTSSQTTTSVTLEQFVKDYWIPLSIEDGTKKPKTEQYYRSAAKVIVRYFGKEKLKDITVLKIEEYFRWMRTHGKKGKPYSEKTIRHHFIALKLMFDCAMKYNLIANNPMLNVKAPPVPRKNPEALTRQELKNFYEGMQKEPLDFQCMLQLFIETGVRLGECLGLQWDDIDLNDAVIHIRRNVSYTSKSKLQVGSPKTANSIRTIPIGMRLVDRLMQYREQMQMKFPNTESGKAFLFPNRSSVFQPRYPDSVTKRVKRFGEREGIPKCKPHILRHTCATYMIESGAPTKDVQYILGHSDASTTLNFYVHADIDSMRRATDLFGELNA